MSKLVYLIILFAFIIFFLSFVPFSIKESFDESTSKKGVVLMYCTPNLSNSWGKYTMDINRLYAQKNNYDFVVVSEPYDNTVTHAWQKIPAMIHLLEKYSFVMYIDTDAIFYNHDTTIESILDKYPKDMIVCSDESNSGGLYKVNGGTVIARKSTSTMELLQKWWDLRHTYKEFAYEQWALSDIYQNKIDSIKGSEYISVAPEHEFNSNYSDVLHYSKNIEQIPAHTFVIHLMSMDDTTRDRVFSQIHHIFFP